MNITILMTWPEKGENDKMEGWMKKSGKLDCIRFEW